MSGTHTNGKHIQAKAIPTGKRNEWLVISYYVSPTMGECHTNYKTVFAFSAEEAVTEVA